MFFNVLPNPVRHYLGGIQHAVDCGIEKIVANDEQFRMLLGFGLMLRVGFPRRESSRQAIDGTDPSMDAAFHKVLAAMTQRARQGLEDRHTHGKFQRS